MLSAIQRGGSCGASGTMISMLDWTQTYFQIHQDVGSNVSSWGETCQNKWHIAAQLGWKEPLMSSCFLPDNRKQILTLQNALVLLLLLFRNRGLLDLLSCQMILIVCVPQYLLWARLTKITELQKYLTITARDRQVYGVWMQWRRSRAS